MHQIRYVRLNDPYLLNDAYLSDERLVLVRGLGELQLQDQIQLGRQELPGLKHADERGRHEDVLVVLRGHGRRHQPGELPEAGDALVLIPFRWFQQ